MSWSLSPFLAVRRCIINDLGLVQIKKQYIIVFAERFFDVEQSLEAFNFRDFQRRLLNEVRQAPDHPHQQHQSDENVAEVHRHHDRVRLKTLNDVTSRKKSNI